MSAHADRHAVSTNTVEFISDSDASLAASDAMHPSYRQFLSSPSWQHVHFTDKSIIVSPRFINCFHIAHYCLFSFSHSFSFSLWLLFMLLLLLMMMFVSRCGRLLSLAFHWFGWPEKTNFRPSAD